MVEPYKKSRRRNTPEISTMSQHTDLKFRLMKEVPKTCIENSSFSFNGLNLYSINTHERYIQKVLNTIQKHKNWLLRFFYLFVIIFLILIIFYPPLNDFIGIVVES